jgi:hypothetical protein
MLFECVRFIDIEVLFSPRAHPAFFVRRIYINSTEDIVNTFFVHIIEIAESGHEIGRRAARPTCGKCPPGFVSTREKAFATVSPVPRS